MQRRLRGRSAVLAVVVPTLLLTSCTAAGPVIPSDSAHVPAPTASPAAAWTIPFAAVGAGDVENPITVLDFGVVPASSLVVGTFGSTGVTLTSLDPATGAVRWQRSSAAWTACAAVISAGQLVCFGSNAVALLDASDGRDLSAFAPEVPVQDVVVSGDAVVLLAYPTSDLSPNAIDVLRVDLAGTVQWRRHEVIVSSKTNIPALSVLPDAGLVGLGVVRADGSPVVLHLSSGEPWTTTPPRVGTPRLLPSGHIALNHPDGTAVFEADGQLVINRPGEVELPATVDRSPSNLPIIFAEEFASAVGLVGYDRIGAQLWQLTGFDRVESWCAGVVVVSQTGGQRVAAINATTGKVVWQMTLARQEGTALGCDGRNLIAEIGAWGTPQARMQWLAMTDGHQVWSYAPTDPEWTATATSAGYVITSARGISLVR